MLPTPLSFDDVGQIVTVFSDAFYDYPVMRFVLGPLHPYDERLRRLVELFVSGRAYRNEPMLGVRRAHQGRGLARVLLETVHEHSRSDGGSSGVSLTTELPANVRLYEHFWVSRAGACVRRGELRDVDVVSSGGLGGGCLPPHTS